MGILENRIETKDSTICHLCALQRKLHEFGLRIKCFENFITENSTLSTYLKYGYSNYCTFTSGGE